MKCERCARELDAGELVMSVPGGFQHTECPEIPTVGTAELSKMNFISLDPNWKFSFTLKPVADILDAEIIE